MLLSSLVVLLLGSAVWGSQTTNGRPNIIVILLDDLGYHDIGYTNPKMVTPHLDKLARNGRILTRSYFQNSCSPSRAALLSGIYPHRTRIERPIDRAVALCLPTNIKILPEYLKEVGYKTHYFGKWQLGFCQDKCTPVNRGFHTFDGMYGGSVDYYNHTGVGGRGRYYDWQHNDVGDKTVLGEYVTTLITDKATDLLKAHDPSTGPFFMELAHPAPHVPLQAPTRFTQMYHAEEDERRRVYMGQVSAVDHEVGRLVSSLKANGHFDNTIILFASDNGGEGIMGPSDNTPLRGIKASMFEGGIRVLSFISGPPIENWGTSHDGYIHAVDWLPSILSMAGIDPASYANETIDGIDQSGMLLRGEDSLREEIPVQINPRPVSVTGNFGLINGPYKLLWGFVGFGDGYGRETFISFDPNYDYVREGFDPVEDIEYPYAKFREPGFQQALVPAALAAMPNLNDIDSGEVHLFNIREDPEERVDLATLAEHQGRITSMKLRILEHVQNAIPTPPGTLRVADALAALVDGTWHGGWCEKDDFSIPK